MVKKKLIMTVAIMGTAGLLASGPVAYAAANEEAPASHEKTWNHKDFFKDLNLTPEQKEKIEAERETQKGLRKPVREQLKIKIQALHEELSKSMVDRAVLNGLIADINTLKGQLFSQRIDGVLALKQILTPEQFAKIQAKFAAYRQKHDREKKRDGSKDE